MKVKSLSRVRLLATPRTAAYQAPPSMGFSSQEYWSGLPLPSSNLSTSGRISLLMLVFRVYVRLPPAGGAWEPQPCTQGLRRGVGTSYAAFYSDAKDQPRFLCPCFLSPGPAIHGQIFFPVCTPSSIFLLPFVSLSVLALFFPFPVYL